MERVHFWQKIEVYGMKGDGGLGYPSRNVSRSLRYKKYIAFFYGEYFPFRLYNRPPFQNKGKIMARAWRIGIIKSFVLFIVVLNSRTKREYFIVFCVKHKRPAVELVLFIIV